jgi:hypothetical protein
MPGSTLDTCQFIFRLQQVNDLLGYMLRILEYRRLWVGTPDIEVWLPASGRVLANLGQVIQSRRTLKDSPLHCVATV